MSPRNETHSRRSRSGDRLPSTKASKSRSRSRPQSTKASNGKSKPRARSRPPSAKASNGKGSLNIPKTKDRKKNHQRQRSKSMDDLDTNEVLDKAQKEWNQLQIKKEK